jgi:hypothetical protein
MSTMKTVFALAIGLAMLSLMIMVQLAGATHPRPIAASPLRVSLVPAYEQCASPNRTHGPPLDSPSCNPPVQTSDFLTVGTPDANGAAANSAGFVRIKVVPHQCCPPEDVKVTGTISDVRCKAGTTPCGNANNVGGADYAGQLEMDATVRLSDHNNGPHQNEAATMVDIPFPVSMSCGNTSDPSIGGLCSVTTSPLTLVPESGVPARAVVGITQIQVFDGGADGFIGSDDNTLFMNQGIFIP